MSRKNTPALAGVSILTKPKASDAGAGADASRGAAAPTEKATSATATPAGAAQHIAEDPSARITLRLPYSQLRALKLLALDERSNVTALITEALADYLRGRKPG